MYQIHREVSYAELSYHSAPSLPPSSSIPNPSYYPSHSSDPYLTHPPPSGFDPYISSVSHTSHVAGFEARPAFYSDPITESPSWVVKHAPPVKYSPAIQPLNREVVAPVNYDASLTSVAAHADFVVNNPRRKLKRPKAVMKKKSVGQKVRCELCKIECPDIQLYEKHICGKKHTKNVQKIYAPGTSSSAAQAPSSIKNGCTSGEKKSSGGQGISSGPAGLEAKKLKLLEGGTAVQSLRVCMTCNVACNGEIAYADHLAGKKHMAQLKSLCAVANSNPMLVINPVPKSLGKIPKKTNSGGPAWCEVCKISCTSSDGLIIHKQGKKHKKNEKLQNPQKDTVAPAPNGAPQPSKNTATKGLQNVGVTEGNAAELKPKKKKGARSVEPEDVETKKRKVLECGAAAEAVRTCAICNVVCNSETVFKSHMAGQKHAAMAKQAQALTSATDQQLVSTEPQLAPLNMRTL